MKTVKKTANQTRLAKPSGRNGNQLPVGAHPGNTGGKKGRSGRTPEDIRRRLRDSLDSRINVLEEIADAVHGSNDGDRVRVLELMGKYGLGIQHVVTLEGFPGAQAALYEIERVIRDNAPAVTAEAIINRIPDALRKLK